MGADIVTPVRATFALGIISCSFLLAIIFFDVLKEPAYGYHTPNSATRYSLANYSMFPCHNGCIYNLIIGEHIYPIKYYLMGVPGSNNPDSVKLEQINVNQERNSLNVYVQITEGSGILTLYLPKNVIAATDGDGTIDIPFTASQNGTQLDYLWNRGKAYPMEVVEPRSPSTDTDENRQLSVTTRILNFAFNASGMYQLEIIGTRIIPEFGSITMPVMAVAIVGTVIAARRFWRQ